MTCGPQMLVKMVITMGFDIFHSIFNSPKAIQKSKKSNHPKALCECRANGEK
jgi:hypothetical protein